MIFTATFSTILYIFIPSVYYILQDQWYLCFIFLLTAPIMFYIFGLLWFFIGLLFTLFERKPRYRFTYYFVKSFLKFVRHFVLFFKLKVKVPFPLLSENERVIIIANHKSKLDPLLLLLACPFPISFTPKQELYKSKILGYILDKIRCVGINRSDIRQTITSLNTAKENIKYYNTRYVVFPEGGTHNRESEGLYNQKPAAYKIVLDTNASILPITIKNNLDFMKHRRKTIEVTCHEIIPSSVIAQKTTIEVSELLESIITCKN